MPETSYRWVYREIPNEQITDLEKLKALINSGAWELELQITSSGHY